MALALDSEPSTILSAHPLGFLIGQLETHYIQFNRIGSTSALVSLFRELLSFGLRSGCRGEKLRGKEITGKSFVQGEPLLVCSVPILRRVSPTSSHQAFANNFPQGERNRETERQRRDQRNRKEHFEENRRN